MNKSFIALGLALGLASANTLAGTIANGSIHFEGRIDSGTCPIEIIDPVFQNPIGGNRILMGNVDASVFKSTGDQAAERTFGMRITPGGGCTIPANTSATVTFTGAYGGAGSGGTLFALASGGAQDLALVLKDDAGTPIAHGGTSKDYPLDETKPTTMLFSAAYESTAASVTPGPANTSVAFTVDIP